MSTSQIRHVFICANRKSNGKGCATFGSDDVFEYLKQQLKEKSPLFKDSTRRVKVVKTSCLGRCSVGPNIYISPDDVWYTFESLKDIDTLIEAHFIQGKVCQQCLHKT